MAGSRPRLGLPVPSWALVQVDPAFGAAEPDEDSRSCSSGSPGINLGLDFLPGALAFDLVSPAPRRTPQLAADAVWVDALVTNVDRTPRAT